MVVVEGIITAGATEILKKLISFVENEITLVWDFNDELKELQNTLNMILTVMEDAEKKQVSQAFVRLWMKDLKAIAYDAEDILDEYSYEVILWKREKEEQDNSTFFSKVCNLCSNSSISFVCSWNLAHQIKEINERFKIIANCKNDLGLHTIDVGSSSTSSHELMMKNRETNSFVPEDWKIFGRENDKSTIIKMLLEQKEEENSSNNQSGDSKHVSVIPIVGLGGIGKTTLAQEVYNDPAVKKHFDIKVWICVSDPFDVKKLLKNIASSIGVANDAATMDDIACHLQDALRRKKFLLVLDDVWNENFEDWRKLKTPLMFGAEAGSKILVTTRNVKAAELMKDKFQPYQLGILNENDCWNLFKEIAFGSIAGAGAGAGAEETSNLVEIGKDMVKRCRGLPLAVIFLGSLMRSKKKEEEEWKIIRDTKLWHESREGKNSEILPSLRLSYDYLPSHLKLCFSYCCLFPKDWIIQRETLIRLWMAEGFLIESPGENNTMSMEEIGNEYFHSLLSSFFFQDAVKDGNGDIETCKMHDLVHDLARSVVGNHECLIVESAGDIEYISEETRRLNLLVDLDDDDDEEMLAKVKKAMKKAKKLRTVFVNKIENTSFDIGNAFKENKRLRVLDLSGSRVTTTESTYYSSSIGGELKHLRYLAVDGGACFPKGVIGRLRLLQTLLQFNVGVKKVWKNNTTTSVIEELEGLNLVRVLCIANLENVTSGKDACRANLKQKKNLRSLELDWDCERDDEAITNDEAVLEGLRPHPNLRTFEIKGFQGSKLPRWIQEDSSSCLPNVVELTFDGICIEQVAGFGALPSLRSLTLTRVYKLSRIGNEFYYSSAAGGGDNHQATIAFPSLKKLTLILMDSLKEWVVPVPPPQASTTTNYCFPLLEEITIRWCPNLNTITPTTGLVFPSLKVLNVEWIDGRAAETLVTNSLNSVTTLRLSNIPNLITLPRQGLMENNNTLLSLSIEHCEQFEGFFPPPNKEEEGREGGCSSSLQSLTLYICPALRFNPNILRSLTSLRSLDIQYCNLSKSLQDELICLSSSLEHLEHVKLGKKKTATTTEEEVFEWRKSNTSKELMKH